MAFSIRLTEQEKKIADSYARLHSISLGEAFKQALFEKIKPLDMQIIYKAKSWLNKARRKNLAVRSYDINGLKPVGHLFNQEY